MEEATKPPRPRPRAMGPCRPALAGTALASLFLASLLLGGAGCRSRVRLEKGDAAVVVAPPRAGGPGTASEGALTEQEPNGENGAPTALHFAAATALEVIGTLADGDEEDRFLLDLPAPPPPPAAPDGTATPGPAPPPRQLALELSPSAALATRLTVTTPDGQPLGVSSGAAGERHGLPNLAVTPGMRLAISVKLARKLGTPAPEAYSVAFNLAELGAGDEREPNETAAVATLLGPAHTAPEVAGFLASAQDVDWYRVPVGAVSELTVVSVELEPPPETSASLSVIAGNGETRLAGSKGGKGRRLAVRQLNPAALTAGATGEPVFYLAVRADSGPDRERKYLLRVRAEDAPPSEREPNDDPGQATPFAASSLNGFLLAGDVDHFQAEVAKGQSVTVSLEPAKRSDLVLEALLPGQARWAKADAGRRGQKESLTLLPEADGRLVLRVTAKKGGEPDDDPYRISLEGAQAAEAR